MLSDLSKRLVAFDNGNIPRLVKVKAPLYKFSTADQCRAIIREDKLRPTFDTPSAIVNLLTVGGLGKNLDSRWRLMALLCKQEHWHL